MTIQIAVKLPDDVVDAIDQLVRAGGAQSRSDAVRTGLGLLLRRSRSDAIDQAFADGFRRMPEQADELDDAWRLGVAAIDDEPWERWW
jgi:Arc/MetJ-type ribon-helix-helix transcriptional regulator